jgi:hypothetical protein
MLASWIAKISAWLAEVAAIDCFIERHEIHALPHIKTYPVCDRPLCGSYRYHASAKPTIPSLHLLEKYNPCLSYVEDNVVYASHRSNVGWLDKIYISLIH